MQEKNILEVKKLSMGFEEACGYQPVLQQVSFSLQEGEILGIVGESGSGKSMTSLAIMDLLGEKAVVKDGSIVLNGIELTRLSKKELRALKGKEMAMIFQEPMTSLNPLMRVGKQLEEMLLLHRESLRKEEIKSTVIESMKEVGLSTADKVYDQYPHELSGGMRQRIMIAMAMLLKPKLIIADEPTTALDVTIQAQILKLLQEINEKFHTSIILISHDLGVIRSICNRVLVMYEGQIVEQGNVKEILNSPTSDYTKKLIAAIPKITEEQLKTSDTKKTSVLHVKDYHVYYKKNNSSVFSKSELTEIVKGVSFEVNEGEVFGIVGESSSGKSTLVKAIIGLNPYTKGSLHCKVPSPQMVFQDPYSSLNPAKKVGWIVEEPLRIQGKTSREKRREKVLAMLERVGLQDEYYDRSIRTLSGGQRQRVALATALIAGHKLIVLDEPVSALDVTIQRQIMELLKELKKEFGLTYLFISHDLNVVYELCDRIAVMKEGRIIEIGTRAEIYFSPKEEYTRSLLQAVLH